MSILNSSRTLWCHYLPDTIIIGRSADMGSELVEIH